VVSFVHAHAQALFGTRAVLAAAVDVNPHASRATARTAGVAQADNPGTHGVWLGAVAGDLTAPWRGGAVDVLVFNPPYVPTDEMPVAREAGGGGKDDGPPARRTTKSGLSFEEEEYLLSLSWAGGRDGMEVTDRLIDALPHALSARGCAYILLCARNRPDEVKARIRRLGGEGEWCAETVSESGAKAGWEKLCVVRAWRRGSQ
jgi:release factor glutamine methyltransferase